MKSVKYSVKNSIIRVVIVYASTFKGSKQLPCHKAVLFVFLSYFYTFFLCTLTIFTVIG